MIPYSLRYSRRVKRLRIEIAPRNVTVVAPFGTGAGVIEAFVLRHANAVTAKQRVFQAVASSMMPAFYEHCTELSVLGKTAVLPQSLVQRRDRELCVVKWLDGKLMSFLEEKREKYKMEGLVPAGIRLGNAGTRWGSCSIKGRIMINRKLVHAPAEVTEYVLVHELVHLVHRNHSPYFWKTVKHHLGEVKTHRKWLNLQGVFLMSGEIPATD
jgi:predicted metal-dependent hydrolase